MHGFLIAAVLVAGVSAVLDWRTGLIPNWITLPAFLGGPLAHVIYGIRVQGLTANDALQEGGVSSGGAILCSLLSSDSVSPKRHRRGRHQAPRSPGAIGQVTIGIEMELYAFLAAAIIAPARLAYDGKLLKTLKNTGLLFRNTVMPKDKRIPIDAEAMSWFRFGPAIFIGTVVSAVLRWNQQPCTQFEQE